MRRTVVTVVSAAWTLALLSSGPALAGPYSDELSKCLVRSTTDDDKNYLVKWMFAAVTVHPAVRSIASVSDAQREELNRNAAKLVERLLTESCRNETREAVKYEGPGTLQASFQVLGQVAGRGLFADPGVIRSMSAFENYFDTAKLNRLLAPDN